MKLDVAITSVRYALVDISERIVRVRSRMLTASLKERKDMERITKQDLERQVNVLNSYFGIQDSKAVGRFQIE